MSNFAILPLVVAVQAVAGGGVGASIVGLAALPVSQAAIWAGKKVMKMGENSDKSKWQQIGLKISGGLLVGVGAVLGVSGAVLVGLGSASALGLAGASVGFIVAPGPVGTALSVAGGVVGVATGLFLGGLAVYSVVNSLPEKQ